VPSALDDDLSSFPSTVLFTRHTLRCPFPLQTLLRTCMNQVARYPDFGTLLSSTSPPRQNAYRTHVGDARRWDGRMAWHRELATGPASSYEEKRGCSEERWIYGGLARRTHGCGISQASIRVYSTVGFLRLWRRKERKKKCLGRDRVLGSNSLKVCR